MNSAWDVLFSFWCIALSGLCFVFVKVIGTLSRKVDELKFKAVLHEEMIMKLSNEVVMCCDYLRDHCMFCMYDMNPDGKEEDAK